MNKQTVVVHSFNGFAEGEEKFVEVDGKKFVDDGAGKPKVGADGQPIPFEEKKIDVKIEDLSNAQLEELAKVNPHVAKMLSDKKQLEDDIATKQKDEEDRVKKDLESKGEWQRLATERESTIDELKKKLSEKDIMLGKYAGSVETILKEVLATIPKDNQALIPSDYSPRQKLEYITKNAKMLGAKVVVGKDGGVDKNDTQPSATDEEVLINEIDALMKKGASRTSLESQQLRDKGIKLTEIRREKDKNKK